MLRYLIIYFVLFLSINSSYSKNYFIHSAGSDSASGTSISSAWRSTENIPSLILQAGDSVLFEGGAAFEGRINFNSPVKGTATHPVVFSSFTTEKGKRAKIISGDSTGFYALNCEGIKIINLHFIGSGKEKNNGSGILFYSDLPGSTKLKNIIIESVEVSNYKWSGIEVGSKTDRSGFADITISDCLVHDNGDIGITSSGNMDPDLDGYNHNNIKVIHCKVYNNSGLPDIGSHSGNGIVLSYVSGALIEHCESYNNGWLSNSPDGGPVGIWCWESDSVLIQFNESHHNRTGNNRDGGGFDFDGGTRNSIMQYNYSHDNMGPGFLLAQFPDARKLFNVTIRYNITQNDGYAFLLWSSGAHGGIEKADIYNNTSYSGGSAICVSIISDFIYNTKFLNNIFYTDSGYTIDAQFTPDVKFFGNCYWASGKNIRIKWGSKEFDQLNDWINFSGNEILENTTGVFANPLLINPGQGTTISDTDSIAVYLDAYKLNPSSPVINKGINLYRQFSIDPGERDFYGNPLNKENVFDIGAFQSGDKMNE